MLVLSAETCLPAGAQTATQLELARLQEILANNPADALAHYQIGLVYRQLGDNRHATVNLEAAIDGGFDNLGARLNLIEAAFACRESTLALATAKQVISPNLKSADVLLRARPSCRAVVSDRPCYCGDCFPAGDERAAGCNRPLSFVPPADRLSFRLARRRGT